MLQPKRLRRQRSQAKPREQHTHAKAPERARHERKTSGGLPKRVTTRQRHTDPPAGMGHHLALTSYTRGGRQKPVLRWRCLPLLTTSQTLDGCTYVDLSSTHALGLQLWILGCAWPTFGCLGGFLRLVDPTGLRQLGGPSVWLATSNLMFPIRSFVRSRTDNRGKIAGASPRGSCKAHGYPPRNPRQPRHQRLRDLATNALIPSQN